VGGQTPSRGGFENVEVAHFLIAAEDGPFGFEAIAGRLDGCVGGLPFLGSFRISRMDALPRVQRASMIELQLG